MSPARRKQLTVNAEYMQGRFDRAESFAPETRSAILQAYTVYGISAGEILSGSHERLPVQARTFVIHRLRAQGFTGPWIARQLGGIHHTTVLHALKKRIDIDVMENSGVTYMDRVIYERLCELRDKAKASCDRECQSYPAQLIALISYLDRQPEAIKGKD